ncbi:TetR/AcrR family transcriptional regulator [Erysipelothrix sp. HDW6C]|uniref:TetR/AcrR family transcriptional regulator n=1 Tax=Erysipelothrix sp. HDW6C TaxID=2714930 RepID=UPI00140B907A|nr:TetR/AcrR family transcriptional regulator [Erysipelothrix sp. HDW6C]QIK69573.1 TetR/AcrR family transcriptional regulator [Erysipelothrix sp. HDW6C]
MKNRYDSEATINDILDVATALFIEKGYEKTSIQDIVKGLDGLTRGAIYHHFDSKDDIISAVMRRMFPENDYFAQLKHRTDLTGLEKLREVYLESIFNDQVQSFFMQSAALLKNPRFFVEYMKVNASVFSPQIMELLDEGNADGSLDVKYTKYVSEVVLLLLGTWFVQEIFPVTVDEFREKIYATKYILDSIGIDLLNDEIMKKTMVF